MKRGFSLMEMIFAIIIVGIIAGVAVPKLMTNSQDATVATIKQDFNLFIQSIQTYYMIHGKIEKISDAVAVNSSNWDLQDLSVEYKEDDKSCLKLIVANDKITTTIDKSAGTVCQKIYDEGIRSNNFDLK